MFHNRTSVSNYTVSDDVDLEAPPLGFIIIYALTIAAFIYGVTSWCLIKKFRNYRNFVFLNAILPNLLLFSFIFVNGENKCASNIIFYAYTVKH